MGETINCPNCGGQMEWCEEKSIDDACLDQFMYYICTECGLELKEKW